MNLIADIPTHKAIASGVQWSVLTNAMNMKATERAFKTLNNNLKDILENT